MIKGFVTVGTTAFDSLIEALDRPCSSTSLTFQTADGSYVPVHHSYVRFVPSIMPLVEDANFVITHAGAGTVYSLLETRAVRLAVVANLERSDKHQSELARYVAENQFACVLSVEDIRRMPLEEVADRVMCAELREYTKDRFFKVGEIVNYLRRTSD